METVTPAEVDLSGTHVLVVEDDYFIAAEICSALSRRGATIIGPAADIGHGTSLAGAHSVDVAVLDINLHGEAVFGLTRERHQRGTEAIFATGYDPGVVPDDLTAVRFLEKPIDLVEWVHAVHSLRQRAAVSAPTLAEERPR